VCCHRRRRRFPKTFTPRFAPRLIAEPDVDRHVLLRLERARVIVGDAGYFVIPLTVTPGLIDPMLAITTR
jgi:hypothetical protein